MSILEDLIGKPLDKISDEELEELVMKGREAREAPAPPKVDKVAKTSKLKKKTLSLNLDDLDL